MATHKLYLLTGPWASGKTTTTELLLLTEAIVLDWDSIISPLSLVANSDVRTDPTTWPGLKATWATIVTLLISNGRSVLLIGPTTPEDWSESGLADTPTECAYLDWPNAIIEARLRSRGTPEDGISEELQFLEELRSSDYTAITLDTQTPEQVAGQVTVWIRSLQDSQPP
jgi:hypothetical protein